MGFLTVTGSWIMNFCRSTICSNQDVLLVLMLTLRLIVKILKRRASMRQIFTLSSLGRRRGGSSAARGCTSGRCVRLTFGALESTASISTTSTKSTHVCPSRSGSTLVPEPRQMPLIITRSNCSSVTCCTKFRPIFTTDQLFVVPLDWRAEEAGGGLEDKVLQPVGGLCFHHQKSPHRPSHHRRATRVVGLDQRL